MRVAPPEGTVAPPFTYQVTINDRNGGAAVQNVVVTVAGTDDAFLIASGQVIVLSGDALPYPVIENDGTIQTSSNNPSTIFGSVILEIDGAVDSGHTVSALILEGVLTACLD